MGERSAFGRAMFVLGEFLLDLARSVFAYGTVLGGVGLFAERVGSAGQGSFEILLYAGIGCGAAPVLIRWVDRFYAYLRALDERDRLEAERSAND